MNLADNTVWVWLKASDLNAEHDILQAQQEYDAILFIWDEKWFADNFFSKQRLFFIWQCLQDFKDLPMVVVKGETNQVIQKLYKDNPETIIFTPESHQVDAFDQEYIKPFRKDQFIEFNKTLPFSFSQYWKTAEKQLFAS